MNVIVRSETAADEAAIHALTVAAFREAVHTSHTEQFIVDALRKAGALSVSLVAESNGLHVGHIAASPVVITDGSPGWFGLGPLSVLPGYQGRGIGSRLMREVLDTLKDRGAAGCVLLGEPAYYGRFGFEAKTGLILPDVPPQFFQALPFGAALPQGTVSYHAAFSAQS